MPQWDGRPSDVGAAASDGADSGFSVDGLSSLQATSAVDTALPDPKAPLTTVNLSLSLIRKEPRINRAARRGALIVP